MEISLPAALEDRLDVAAAAVHLAVGLYTAEETTLGQSAELASMSQTEFLHELGRRQIPIRYGRKDFVEDLATIRELSRK